MQSIFGALLTAGYATAFAATISQSGQHVSDNVQNELTKSFDGAQAVAAQYPQYAGQIEAAAKAAFLQGDSWAYLAGIIAVLGGAALVAFFFPKKEREEQLLASYEAEDAGGAAAEPPPAAPAPAST